MHIKKDRGKKMKKTILTITSLIFLVISANPFIDIFISTAGANEKAPEEYVIVKFDTLWDISNTKLADPFLWPRLWNVNPHIKNPDLIYPGTKLIIPSLEELMAIPYPTRGKMPISILKKKIIAEVPQLVFEHAEEKVNPYIVDRQLFLTSGWIAKKIPGIGKIAHSEKGSKLVDKDDIVYLETDDEVRPGKRFFTFKVIKKVSHPVTDEKMGHQVGLSGVVEIIETRNNLHKAIIKSTFDDITVGDGLLTYRDMEPPMISDQPRVPDVSGYVVESRTNSSISSRGDIIYIDKGSDDGIEVGDVVSAISYRPVKRSIGELQIIALQPETSTAFITESDGEISKGDPWGQMD
jgi:hypothetical protein